MPSLNSAAKVECCLVLLLELEKRVKTVSSYSMSWVQEFLILPALRQKLTSYRTTCQRYPQKDGPKRASFRLGIQR